jgi:subtilisin family serine protease
MRSTRLLLGASLLVPALVAGAGHASRSELASSKPASSKLTAAACSAANAPAGRVIVLLRQTAADRLAGQDTVLGQLSLAHARNVTAFHIIDAVAATVDAATSCQLARDPGVQAVVPDRQLQLQSFTPPRLADHVVSLARRPAATLTEPESLGLTGATTVQQGGDTGQGVLVADIDSGMDTTQPNLQGVLAKSSAGKALYKDFTGTGLEDSVGHGTGTAGMMVSQGVSTYEVSTTPYYGPIAGDPTVDTAFRVLGMAPSAKLIVAKVFDARAKDGGGFESWIVSAIQWVVDNHAQVINESFGWQDIPTNKNDPVVLADDAAAAAGVVVCVAAGNSGSGFGTVADPAASPDVLSVGASTMFRGLSEDGYLAPYGKYTSDSLASFSSLGPTTDGQMAPDIVAPGENGWSVFAVTGPAAGAGVGLFGGTSQASPIVAGAAALVISAYEKRFGKAPPLGYVKQLLMNNADDLGFDAEQQSSGRVDVARAVAAVDGTGPDVAITPSVSMTGTPGQVVTAPITLTNNGSTSVAVSATAFTEEQSAPETFQGTTPASQTGASSAFKVTVPAGQSLLTATAVWRTSDEQGLIVQLFNPQGDMTNYGSGGGIASIEAAHPEAGTWVVYVGNGNGKAEPFQLEVTTSQEVAVGKVTPASTTLAAGASATVDVSLAMPAAAGRSVYTLQVKLPTGIETVPVITTVDVPAGGRFSGEFTSPSATGLDAELYTYDVVVPASATSISVAASWQHLGDGVELFLVSPAHVAVAHSSYSVKSLTTSLSWSKATAGTWQVVVSCPVFDGLTFDLPFTGSVTS